MDTEQETDSDSPSKRLECPEKGCHATFAKNRKLQIHLRRHTGERPFVCNVGGCDKTYTNSSHLQRHKLVSHSENKQENVVICGYEGCGIQLSNKFSLRKHYNRKHNPENMPFKCAICLEKFHRKKLLQQHLFSHTGLPSFKCNKCSMGFGTEALLKKHQSFHRIYRCDCGEIFHRWSLMQLHRRECKPKKINFCEICDKVFSTRNNLKIHKITHLDDTEKTVFKCTVEGCQRSYFFKKNLDAHLKSYHRSKDERERFPCTQLNCNRILQTRRGLKNHLEWHARPKTVPKARQPRWDKGIPKKSMASFLSGLEENQEKLKKTEETPMTLKELQSISVKPALKQCLVVVSRIDSLITAG